MENKDLNGLTDAQAKERLKKDGLNEVPEPEFNFFKEFNSNRGNYFIILSNKKPLLFAVKFLWRI